MKRATFNISLSTGLESVLGYLVEVPELGIIVGLDRHVVMVGYPQQWRASEFRTGTWMAEGRTRDAAVAEVMNKAQRAVARRAVGIKDLVALKEAIATLTAAFLKEHKPANGGAENE